MSLTLTHPLNEMYRGIVVVTIKIVSGCWSLTILNVGIIKKYVRLLYAFLINVIKRVSTICFERVSETKERLNEEESMWQPTWIISNRVFI